MKCARCYVGELFFLVFSFFFFFPFLKTPLRQPRIHVRKVRRCPLLQVCRYFEVYLQLNTFIKTAQSVKQWIGQFITMRATVSRASAKPKPSWRVPELRNRSR